MAELVKVLSQIEGSMSGIFFVLLAIEIILIFKNFGGKSDD